MCGQTNDELSKLCKFHEINVSNYKGKQSKTKIARNLVDYEDGKTIFQVALDCYKSNKINQLEINFDL